MTTDTLETALTEDVAPENETQATLPDTPADSPAVEEPTSAAPATDPLQSFLDEKGYDTEAEAATTGTEPESQGPTAEVLAEAARIAETQRQAEIRQREEEGIYNAFVNRANGIRNYLLNKGLDPLDADRVVQEFNSHHGQSGTVHRREAITEAGTNFTKTLYSAAEKELPGVTKGDYGDTASFMKAVVMQARKGYVREADVKTRMKSELSEFKAHLDKLGYTAGSKAPPSESGSIPTSKVNDLDWSLNAPISEIAKARQSRA
jgi:hypothetical protein